MHEVSSLATIVDSCEKVGLSSLGPLSITTELYKRIGGGGKQCKLKITKLAF